MDKACIELTLTLFMKMDETNLTPDQFEIFDRIRTPFKMFETSSEFSYKENMIVIVHKFNDGFVYIPGTIQSEMKLKKGDKLLISIQRMENAKRIIDSLKDV